MDLALMLLISTNICVKLVSYSLIHPCGDFIYDVPGILNFDKIEIISKNGFWSF